MYNIIDSILDYFFNLWDMLYEIWKSKCFSVVIYINISFALIYIIWVLYAGDTNNGVYIRAFLYLFVSIILGLFKEYESICEKFSEYEYKIEKIRRKAGEYEYKYVRLKRLIGLIGHIYPEKIVIASTKDIEVYDGPPAARMYANGRIVADDKFDGFPTSQEQIRYYFWREGESEVLWAYWCLYCDFLRLKTEQKCR